MLQETKMARLTIEAATLRCFIVASRGMYVKKAPLWVESTRESRSTATTSRPSRQANYGARFKSWIQFVSQVLPPSGENACSQWQHGTRQWPTRKSKS